MFTRRLLTSRSELIELANKLGRFPHIGLDTESSGPLLVGLRGQKSMVNVYRSTLSGISLATPELESFYIPITHRQGNADLEGVRKLARALEAYDGECAIHNVKHELAAVKQFRGFRIPIPSQYRCTQVLMWALQLEAPGKSPYGLKQLALHYLKQHMRTFDETTGGADFSSLPPPEALDYACEDAEVALQLWNKYNAQLLLYPGLRETYLETEMPLCSFLQEMEEMGMGLDSEEVIRYTEEFSAKMGELEDAWMWAAPAGISIRSPKQLQRLYKDGVWDSDGVPKGKDGGYSTEAEFVKLQLAACSEGSLGHTLAKLKLEYNKYQKLVSTYGLKLLDLAHQHPDGRLHCSYHHTGTRTGRLSSANPNLQNIPVRSKEGKRIRKAFVEDEGYVILSADYSQIELRVLAHLCKRGALYDGFHAGEDPHDATAKAMGCSRDGGKTGNFAAVYGSGARKVAKALNCSVDEGKRFLQQLRERMPEVWELVGRFIAMADQKGYVKTLSGRTRRIDTRRYRDKLEALEERGLNWRNSATYREVKSKLGSEERKAGNTPIQGGARDVMTRAMLNVRKALGSYAPAIGQVHDDLLLRVPADRAEYFAPVMQEVMESAYPLRVPLKADPVWGPTWASLKE